MLVMMTYGIKRGRDGGGPGVCLIWQSSALRCVILMVLWVLRMRVVVAAIPDTSGLCGLPVLGIGRGSPMVSLAV